MAAIGNTDDPGLGDVPVGGGDAHAEPGAQLGVGVTAAQMGQNQQRLPSGGQPTPSACPVPGERAASSQARKRRAEVDDRCGLGRQARGSSWWTGDLGRDLVYQEHLPVRTPLTPTTH